MPLTILQPVGYDAHSCGYCSPAGERSKKHGSRSFGFITEQMTPQFYQDLINHGWRRSGEYTYHPDMAHTCCPQYTIRLKVAAFKPSRQQRSSLNRWNRYLSGADEPPKKHGKGKAFELGPELRRCREGYAKASDKMAHRFTTELTPAIATDETYNLYRRYQIAIHNDPPSKVKRSGFERFLCDSPLGDSPIAYAAGADTKDLPDEYGSYHMLYRVDGKLVGISVIDILPSCVSSVYFIWDPDWAWASLGKLSALYEIGLTLDMAAAGAKGMEWLYMGYWIATCQKMRYKGEYAPSFLLDPDTQRFHPLTPKLDQYLQVHGGYTPFTEIEAMEDKAVKEEYEAHKGAKGDDIVMAEPREHRPKKSTAKALESNGGEEGGDDNGSDDYTDDSDSEDGDEDDHGPTDYPTPPPPGFGDPHTLDPAALNDLFVFFVQGESPGVIPYAAFRSSLTPMGRKITKELVAALGRDMFAREPQHLRAGNKALLNFG